MTLEAAFHWDEIEATGKFCSICKGMITGNGMIYMMQIGRPEELDYTTLDDTITCKKCYLKEYDKSE